MKRLRISAISFLNTAPLMWDFERGERRKDFEIDYTIPSACAEALRRGAADIGIIPAISYQTIPDLVVIPDVAIAAKGPVRSILLVSKVPVREIKRVAVDTSSRTSVGLLHTLFAECWRPSRNASSLPQFVPMEPNLAAMVAACDAALLIGDPALTVDRTQYHVLDLAEEWHRHTGLPFVFAFWAVCKRAIQDHPLRDELAEIFQQSRDHGLANVEAIARAWAPRVGMTEPAVKAYLEVSINYALDDANREGLSRFYRLLEKRGITQSCRELEFLPLRTAVYNSVSGAVVPR
jgi:chorismate dehydratase